MNIDRQFYELLGFLALGSSFEFYDLDNLNDLKMVNFAIKSYLADYEIEVIEEEAIKEIAARKEMKNTVPNNVYDIKTGKAL